MGNIAVPPLDHLKERRRRLTAGVSNTFPYRNIGLSGLLQPQLQATES